MLLFFKLARPLNLSIFIRLNKKMAEAPRNFCKNSFIEKLMTDRIYIVYSTAYITFFSEPNVVFIVFRKKKAKDDKADRNKASKTSEPYERMKKYNNVEHPL